MTIATMPVKYKRPNKHVSPNMAKNIYRLYLNVTLENCANVMEAIGYSNIQCWRIGGAAGFGCTMDDLIGIYGSDTKAVDVRDLHFYAGPEKDVAMGLASTCMDNSYQVVSGSALGWLCDTILHEIHIMGPEYVLDKIPLPGAV